MVYPDLTSVFMSRFLAVVVPVSSLGYRTITNAKLAICLTWLTPMVMVTPVWWAHNLLHLQSRESSNSQSIVMVT